MTAREDQLGQDLQALADRRGWSKEDWCERGVYMHLEVSELIEAIRGKGDPLHEAGDVLVTFTGLLVLAGLSWDDVVTRAEHNLKEKM